MANTQLVLMFPGRAPRGQAALLRGAQEEALRQVLKYWGARILPRHFTVAGARLYGYAPRGENYLKRKLRRSKTSDPLVYTGLLKTVMLGLQASPVVSGRSGALVFRGLPYYVKLRQKVSMAQIAGALSKHDGDLKAAAKELLVSVDTIYRRTKNKVDRHEGARVSAWRITVEETDRLVKQWQSVDAIGHWELMHAAAKEAFSQTGGDIKAAANKLGLSMSSFGKYLRNESYHGRASGQTPDKVKEILATTDEESAVMGKIARRVFAAAMG